MRDQLLTFVEDAMKDQLPNILGDALERASGHFSDEGQGLVATVLTVTADVMHEHGTDAVEDMIDELVGLLDGGDPMAVHKLNQRGVMLSDLVDSLQSAEAEEREQATAAVRTFVAVAAEVAEKVVQAGLASLA